MRDDFTLGIKETLAKRVGYHCSNPTCRQQTSGPTIMPDKSINIGVAAHICAASPGGKRYKASMTSEERGGILNGIWLCQTCSKLIDSDEIRYKEELLLAWKTLSEDFAQQELEKKNISEKQTVNITSINQSGGQTAHTIVNERPQRRNINILDQNIIIDELKKEHPEPFEMFFPSGDYEAESIANQIRNILKQAGWNELGFSGTLGGSHEPGIDIFIGRQVSPGQQVLANCLHGVAKLKIRATKYDNVKNTTISIGAHPDNYI